MSTQRRRRARLAWLAPIALVSLTSCEDPATLDSPEAQASLNEPPPSIVFTNGHVITMNPVARVDEAIALRGSRVVRTGATDDLVRFAGPQSQVIDLEGRTIMPGFVDAHSHWFQSSGQYGQDWAGVQELAIRFGTTTAGEPAVSEGFMPGFLAWVDEGNLRMRLNLYMNGGTDYCGNPVSDWWKSYPPSRKPGELLWIAGVKMFSDGGACNQPAVTEEFVPGSGYGDLYVNADQVAAFVSDADALGYQVLIHALGDRGLDEVLDGYAQVMGSGYNPLRHRIEHNNLVREDQIGRYAEIGVLPVVFGHHFTGHLEYQFAGGSYGCPPAPRTAFYQAAEAPIRRIIDSNPGVKVAWHNDNPPWPPLRPMADLDNLVTKRQVFSGGVICDPPSWMLANAITVEEALELMTVNAAWALGREHEVGMLAPGMLADLLVLSDNPLTVSPTDIRNIAIQATLIGGKTEFCMPGEETICPGT